MLPNLVVKLLPCEFLFRKLYLKLLDLLLPVCCLLLYHIFKHSQLFLNHKKPLSLFCPHSSFKAALCLSLDFSFCQMLLVCVLEVFLKLFDLKYNLNLPLLCLLYLYFKLPLFLKELFDLVVVLLQCLSLSSYISFFLFLLNLQFLNLHLRLYHKRVDLLHHTVSREALI